MILASVKYRFRAGFGTGVEKFYIEKGSAKWVYPESFCLKCSVVPIATFAKILNFYGA